MGFVLNFVIGLLAFGMHKATTKLGEVDQATVAGYYGSDSTGTFRTALGPWGRQRLAIPEAGPTLPLSASLGLTSTYNVTIGIPVYKVSAIGSDYPAEPLTRRPRAKKSSPGLRAMTTMRGGDSRDESG